ncbi:unnamed protein product [Diabrotica balteata]|uniref:Fatty acyl-CoA reductase n=1 Tax=Diabrotica balteata TaxID=107213 RepID=A0A9N9T9M0_DIABA|nr:unnamed protein product [Diabrotica balteata]
MTVADFFVDKNVFITGGSGFIGKLLIEKLLRSCSGIGNIYVLLRPKRGNSIEERLEKITKSPIFNPIRHQNAAALKKIIPIKGDICELNLGLSDEDRQLLVNKVNIIYHSAASVRFDDFLKDAIILNVRGTREVAKLALDLKNISMFVHISTTYSNCDKLVVDEKLYPALANWTDAIKLAEEYDQGILEILTQKYIMPFPNTYTFAKSLGEHVVNDLCNGRVPCVITRPSVVIHTYDDPIEGWMDNFNGPVGLLAAGGKGILRVVYAKEDMKVDYIPADFVIKGIILATQSEDVKNVSDTVEVYNLSYNHITDMSLGEMIRIGLKICDELPSESLFWYPRVSCTGNFYMYYVQVILFHMLPAIFIDFVLRIIGQKPRLVKLQRNIYIASTVLIPFMRNTYWFLNNKFISMQKNLKEEDYTFWFNYKSRTNREMCEYYKKGKIGATLYLLKETIPVSEREKRKRVMKYWFADRALRILLVFFLLWIFIYKLNLFKLVTEKTIYSFKKLCTR